jgi:CheY-like chemotaxis protein/HPt (histidine-containing phosphotransfer) domain-containing protein
LAETLETTTSTATLERSTKRLAGLKILAAEDVDVNRLILEDMLEQEGAHCTFAVNGREALELVEADATAFDVVLMDVQMPEMDGHEATRRIHAFTQTLPVIGLTAHALAEERTRCLASGMVDHVSKPVNPKILIATILKWVRPAATLAATAVPPVPQQGFPSVTPTFQQDVSPDTPGEIDWQALHACHHGKTAFILKIAKTVADGHAETPQQLRHLAETGDFDALAFLAHKLKGVTGNLFAASALALATTTEAAAKVKDPQSLPLAGQLADQFDRVLAELTRHIAAGTQAPA